MTADVPPPIRLPIWRLVKASLASVFRYPQNFVGRCWPWVAIISALGVGMHIAIVAEMPIPELLAFPTMMAQLAGTTMVVVSWHRGLILGEPGGPSTAFRFDYPFWRYIGCAILIGVSMILPTFGLFAVGSIILDSASAGIMLSTLAMTPAVFIAYLIGARLVVALPMAATGSAPPLLRASWRLTQGNSWRLVGALIVLYLIASIVVFVLVASVSVVLDILDPHRLVQALILSPTLSFGILLNTALLASLASYAFAVLTNHPLGRDVTG